MSHHCPYCKKQVKHKGQCKKYTKELEDQYLEQCKIAEKAAIVLAEEKAKLDEEMLKFAEMFPNLANHIKKRFDEYEYRIQELESECAPCPPYCECSDCNPKNNYCCKCENENY